MPIQQATLEAPENRYLRTSAGETLRQALRHLIATPPRAEPWWYLLAQRSNGSWLAVRFSWLVDLAEEDRGRLDVALGELELPAAHVVERGEVGTGEALRLARSAPGRLVVVMESGQLAGIVCSGPTRGGSFSVGAVEELVGAEEAKLETRYTDIGCPRRVTLGTRRFQVVVRLTIKKPEWSRDTVPLRIDPRQVIQVRLRAPDFTALNDDIQEIPLTPGKDSLAAVFDLRPSKLGSFSIGLDFFQGGNHLGTAKSGVEVTETITAGEDATVREIALATGSATSPPDRILYIAWDDDQTTFELTLIEGGGTRWHSFPKVNLGSNAAAYAQRLYSDLQNWSMATAVRESGKGGFERRLQQAGLNLWRLLPEGFRQLYANERARWQNSSLMVLSDEPYLPWELMWPYEASWQDEEPWCLSMRFSRWLRCDEHGNGNSGARQDLSLAAIAFVAPRDSDLKAPKEERKFLAGLIQEHGLHNASPRVESWEALMALLGSGSFDWLHVATHGSFKGEAADRESVLYLAGYEPFTPEQIVGMDVEGALRKTRPTFFFNACHAGRQGWDWGRLAGWAQRLLACDAGAFLAPLWEVDETTALCFSKALYRQLLADKPVADAVRQARREARKEGDASWLAYSLYAHPNARVRTPRNPA